MTLYCVKKESGHWVIVVSRPQTFLNKIRRKKAVKEIYFGTKGEWYFGELFRDQLDKNSKISKQLDDAWSDACDSYEIARSQATDWAAPTT